MQLLPDIKDIFTIAIQNSPMQANPSAKSPSSAAQLAVVIERCLALHNLHDRCFYLATDSYKSQLILAGHVSSPNHIRPLAYYEFVEYLRKIVSLLNEY